MTSASDSIADLLYGARNRFHAVHAIIDVTTTSQRAASAQLAERDLNRVRLPTMSQGVGTFARRQVDAWVSHPWRMYARDHPLTRGPATRPACTYLKLGDASWITTAAKTIRSSPERPIKIGFEFVFDPAQVLAYFDLTQVGRADVSGREAMVVDARLRLGAPKFTYFARTAQHATKCTLWLDSERGVLLRAEAGRDDVVLCSYVVREIEFDVVAPAGLFEPPQSVSD